MESQRLYPARRPFAEIGGCKLIKTQDMDESVRLAAEFPLPSTDSIEVGAMRGMDAVRRRLAPYFWRFWFALPASA